MLLDLAAAVVGIVIGLRFRAGALMAATLVTLALAIVLQTRAHGLGWHAFWPIVLPVFLLQVGYLAGLALAVLWRRFRGD